MGVWNYGGMELRQRLFSCTGSDIICLYIAYWHSATDIPIIAPPSIHLSSKIYYSGHLINHDIYITCPNYCSSGHLCIVHDMESMYG